MNEHDVLKKNRNFYIGVGGTVLEGLLQNLETTLLSKKKQSIKIRKSVMSKGRMEAFSDGVLAIVITIMVLKLNAPESLTLDAVKEVFPTFLAYVLSFIYVGIYWANHHHLVNMIDSVSGRLLWKNLHWIFWMSLIPTATEWMGLNPYKSLFCPDEAILNCEL